MINPNQLKWVEVMQERWSGILDITPSQYLQTALGVGRPSLHCRNETLNRLRAEEHNKNPEEAR